jgi:hypothetical protein
MVPPSRYENAQINLEGMEAKKGRYRFFTKLQFIMRLQFPRLVLNDQPPPVDRSLGPSPETAWTSLLRREKSYAADKCREEEGAGYWTV